MEVQLRVSLATKIDWTKPIVKPAAEPSFAYCENTDNVSYRVVVDSQVTVYYRWKTDDKWYELVKGPRQRLLESALKLMWKELNAKNS